MKQIMLVLLSAALTATSIPTVANTPGNADDTQNWNGIDLSKYPDIPFYQKDGTAHIKGRIDNYVADTGESNFTLRAYNQLTDHTIINLIEINPDGTFQGDLRIPHPQFDTFVLGDFSCDLFVIPGDTIEITISMPEPDRYGKMKPKYFKFEQPMSESSTITVTTDSITKHYHATPEELSALNVAYTHPDENKVTEANIKLAEKLSSILPDFPNTIGKLPLSTFAKDIAASKVIANICWIMAENEYFFNDNHRPEFKFDSLGNYCGRPIVRLDQRKLLEPVRDYVGLIFDNPLMACTDCPLINKRWAFNDLFRESKSAVVDGLLTIDIILAGGPEDLTTYERMAKIDDANEEIIGIDNSFANQLIRTAFLINRLNDYPKDRENLDSRKNDVGNLMSRLSYPSLSNALLDSYSEFARQVAIKENPESTKTEYVKLNMSRGGDALTELIAPYKGNVIYIDFWEMSCGPCRAGMLAQKKIIEEYAGHPFKVLYVSDDKLRKEEAIVWLEKENIKGEHIFVDKSTWNKFMSLFDFNAIPFGVLIDKQGNVVKLKYSLDTEALLKQMGRQILLDTLLD